MISISTIAIIIILIIIIIIIFFGVRARLCRRLGATEHSQGMDRDFHCADWGAVLSDQVDGGAHDVLAGLEQRLRWSVKERMN